MFDAFRLTRPDLIAKPEDDGRHPLDSAKPRDRESIPYVVSVPEEGLSFFSYTWINSANEAGAYLSVFGPAVGPEPLSFRMEDRVVDPAMDFSEWKIDGFEMNHDLRFKDATCRFKNDKVDLDFDFTAFHPAYHYGAHKDGCPIYCATDRTEQSGWVKGQLKVGGKTYDLDTGGHRDHSWGSRDWLAFLPGYRWFVGQVGTDTSLHFWDLNCLGKPALRGYVAKDGLMAEITDLELDWELDSNFLLKGMVGTITDEAGRKTTLKTEQFSYSVMPPCPEVTLIESGARIWVDGREGIGWTEFAWSSSYLEHCRSIPEYGQLIGA